MPGRLHKNDLCLLGFLGASFLLNQAYIRHFAAPSFFRNYLDDLLCMPLVLLLARCILQLLPLPRTPERLPPYFVVTAFLMFALYFEVILPLYNRDFTADPLDVAVYAAGCLLFACREYRLPQNTITVTINALNKRRK